MTFHLRSFKLHALKLAHTRNKHCVSLVNVSNRADSRSEELNSLVLEKNCLPKLIQELSEKFGEVKLHQSNLHDVHNQSSLQYFSQSKPRRIEHTIKFNKECDKVAHHKEQCISSLYSSMIAKPYLPTQDDILLHSETLSEFWNANSNVTEPSSWQKRTTDVGCYDLNSDIISCENYFVTLGKQPAVSKRNDVCFTETERNNIDIGGSTHVQNFRSWPSLNKDVVSPGGNLDPLKKPNLDQIQLIQDHLADYMPHFFVRKHNYRIYTEDVILENRLGSKPAVYQGLSQYVYRISVLRTMAVIKYANTKMSILKMTCHEEDGTVRIRWRVSGIPQLRAFMFWKFFPWNYKKALSKEAEWYDGFSVLYVDGTGKVSKHVIDKVVPDDQREVDKKGNLAVKLALLLGLTPRSNLGDAMSSWLFKRWNPHKQQFQS